MDSDILKTWIHKKIAHGNTLIVAVDEWGMHLPPEQKAFLTGRIAQLEQMISVIDEIENDGIDIPV